MQYRQASKKEIKRIALGKAWEIKYVFIVKTVNAFGAKKFYEKSLEIAKYCSALVSSFIYWISSYDFCFEHKRSFNVKCLLDDWIKMKGARFYLNLFWTFHLNRLFSVNKFGKINSNKPRRMTKLFASCKLFCFWCVKALLSTAKPPTVSPPIKFLISSRSLIHGANSKLCLFYFAITIKSATDKNGSDAATGNENHLKQTTTGA